jgi:hypothetical protein
MFTIALQPKLVASHLRFIQSRMVQDSFLPIPISGRGGTDMTYPSFVMIFRDDIHSGSDCGLRYVRRRSWQRRNEICREYRIKEYRIKM